MYPALAFGVDRVEREARLSGPESPVTTIQAITRGISREMF
jgi:hypothetical protein